MNWAKNWKISIWFLRKNKYLRDFRVFDFALYPRSRTRKSRKFRLHRIMTLIVIQDLKTPKKSVETKTKIWFRKKRKISDISEFSILLYTHDRNLGKLRKFSFHLNFDSLKSKRMRYGSRKKTKTSEVSEFLILPYNQNRKLGYPGKFCFMYLIICNFI